DRLDGEYRGPRMLGDLVRKPQRRLERPTGLGQAGDQAERIGTICVQRPPGERELSRHPERHATWQIAQRAAGGDKSTDDLGQREVRVAGADEEIARER